MHRQYLFLGRPAVAKAMAGQVLPKEKLYALGATVQTILRFIFRQLNLSFT
jgi:hypothetical protein